MAGKYQHVQATELQEIFRSAKTVAVVGLSDNQARPAYGVARYLQQVGYKIIPVNPLVTEVLGEKAYPSLTAVPGPVDIVDVFRKSEHVPTIVQEAIAKGVKTLWLQEGVSHPKGAEAAEAAGLTVMMDRCILKEHRRLMG